MSLYTCYDMAPNGMHSEYSLKIYFFDHSEQKTRISVLQIHKIVQLSHITFWKSTACVDHINAKYYTVAVRLQQHYAIGDIYTIKTPHPHSTPTNHAQFLSNLDEIIFASSYIWGFSKQPDIWSYISRREFGILRHRIYRAVSAYDNDARIGYQKYFGIRKMLKSFSHFVLAHIPPQYDGYIVYQPYACVRIGCAQCIAGWVVEEP